MSEIAWVNLGLGLVTIGTLIASVIWFAASVVAKLQMHLDDCIRQRHETAEELCSLKREIEQLVQQMRRLGEDLSFVCGQLNHLRGQD